MWVGSLTLLAGQVLLFFSDSAQDHAKRGIITSEGLNSMCRSSAVLRLAGIAIALGNFLRRLAKPPSAKDASDWTLGCRGGGALHSRSESSAVDWAAVEGVHR